MRLTELEAQLVRYAGRDDGGHSLLHVDQVQQADGVMFLCPGCYAKNGGAVGTHRILVYFADRNIPADLQPLPRWKATGNTAADLTLQPSISLHGGCAWHGWVLGGEARNA